MDAFTLYMRDLKQIQRLSLEEQTAMRELARNGDVVAKQKLVESLLPMVIGAALRYRNTESFLDAIQAGNLGVMKAADRWEPSVAAFTTYAFFWIRQCIQKERANSDTIRLPAHWHYHNARLTEAERQIIRQCRVEAQEAAALAATGGRKAISLGEMFRDHREDNPAVAFERRETIQDVRRKMADLPARKREILFRRVMGEKLEEIGIKTVGQFEFLRAGNDPCYPDGLRSVKGFGAATVDAFENDIVNWLAANAREKEPKGDEPETE